LKILLFTEIYDCGGIDTFIINLINNWPHSEDSFVLIANTDYPGLEVVEKNLSRRCEIIRHKALIYPNFMRKNLLQNTLRKLIFLIAPYLLIGYNVFALKKILLTSNADALMVINGGYPGGETCRAAVVSWGIFSNKSYSVLNFHNLVVKPVWYVWLQEYIIDKIVVHFTSNFVTVSRAAKESMVLRPQIFNKNITSYIHNGIEERESPPGPILNIKDEIGISATAPLCIMLATYEPRKGHYFLFQAFKKVLKEIPDAHMLICGFGFPHEINLVQKYVEEFALGDNVHLMNFRTDLSHLMSYADILVVASQAYESFGYTSVEAMAHHVPVVATNVGGIPEVVVNGEGGYCVDSSDVDSYAQCIINLLKNKNLRIEQGKRGYERFRNNFTAERMSRQYAELIHGPETRS
jgi:glycosyltransferase involved in cell wall biosynthesis